MTAPDGLAPDWERWCWPAVRDELLSRRILAMAKPESVTARAERLAAERTAAVVPRFLVAELQGLNCRNQRLAATHPQCIEVCGDG